MNITGYIYKGDERVVYKEPAQEVTMSGQIKDMCRIKTPTIIVSGLTDAQVRDVNYFYIPKFGRYYFRRDITILRDKVYQIELECDVLMSFKEDIENSRGYMNRNKQKNNLYYEDNQMPTRADSYTVVRKWNTTVFNGQTYCLNVF